MDKQAIDVSFLGRFFDKSWKFISGKRIAGKAGGFGWNLSLIKLKSCSKY